MPAALRYAIAALVVVAAAIAAISPLAGMLIEQWSRRDIELRSELVFNSVRGELENLLEQRKETKVINLFERLALDERLMAAGFCNQKGTLTQHSALFPKAVTCNMIGRGSQEGYSTVAWDGRELFVGSFPLKVSGSRGHLVLLHDLSFAKRRGAEARTWILIALGTIALIGAALASIVALVIVRKWLQSVRDAIDDVKAGRPDLTRQNGGSPIAQEIRHLLREFDETRRSIDATYVDWNPEMLRLTLANELPDAEIIAVSNREPYIHNYEGDRLTMQIPASGLVAAIEPVMRACGGTWIAHGSGSADRETVDAEDCIDVPPGAAAYKLRRMWLSDEEQDGYYYGFANEGLWPLCHIAFVRPAFREADWNEYRKVNARFAQAVVATAKRPDPVILIHDYHFALLPRMIREALPDATIITFWHVPWPNAETFGICPWKEEILDGLLGSTVLGFHTQFHCNNFMETVDRYVESRIDRELASVAVRGNETYIRPYPISIEWPPAALANQAPVENCRRTVRARFGLTDDIYLGVGIERFDYTKGILDRLQAVDALLNRHPEWKGRFAFLQVAAPSRGTLSAYRNLQREVRELADDINARHGSGSYKPIILVIRHHEPGEVFELFRAADVCVVSSLHDGMNLVAKEFVASRDDERGVLILSNFAGASRELSEALIVNPYDAVGVSDAIFQALQMPEAEQRERLHLMRDVVRNRNVYRWAGQMLVDAAQLRKRQRIITMVNNYRTARTANRVTRLSRWRKKN